MSNKMLKYFFVSLLVWAAIQVSCFEPEQHNFENNYQFRLYENWLEKGDFRTQFPAKLSPEKVIKTFKDKAGNDVVVEYLWTNGKIAEQREKLPDTSLSQNAEFRQYLDYLENFIYRLNSSEQHFFTDFFAEIEIEYSHFTGNAAINRLWEDYDKIRISIAAVGVVLKIDQTGIKLTTENGKEIIFFFPGTEKLRNFIQQNKITEADKSRKILISKKKETPEEDITEEAYEIPDVAYIEDSAFESVFAEDSPEIYDPQIEQNLPEIDNLTLLEYIRAYHKVRQSKKLLNNQIQDANEFLNTEFPHHQQNRNGQFYSLEKQSFNGFNSKISFQILQSEESVNFVPIQNFEVRNKTFYFEDNEIINLSKLTENEIENLTPFLSQIIYEHRVIGTKLLNFFLIHDAVETTLVVKGETREIYDIYSYANLLLMLNKYWEDRIVYFNLQDVKKVNGYIEFKGMLIADSPESKTFDMAEIRFHLDNEYKIDLAMMFLNPEVLKE